MLRSLGWRVEYILLSKSSAHGTSTSVLAAQPRRRACTGKPGSSLRVQDRKSSVSLPEQSTTGEANYGIPAESIHVVDSFAGLEEMQQHVFSSRKQLDMIIRKPSNARQIGSEGNGKSSMASPLPSDHSYQIVGLDAEWQPSGGFWPVSLLQVSTRTAAFLIDMTWFCRPAPQGWSNAGMELPPLTDKEAALDGFLEALLAAEDIVKAGFAFQGDLRNLCRSFPQMKCFGQRYASAPGDLDTREQGAEALTSYVDLKRLAFRLWPDTRSVEKARGLAKLTALVLGKQLDKTFQVSNWGVRPLTEGQKQYAGSDAHVLTALADRLLDVSGQASLDTFPANLTETLDVADAAQEARLWHRVRPSPDANSQVWSWEPLEALLPREELDPAAAERMIKHRLRQGTPRLPSKAMEHGANFAALQEFLGVHFPKTGRSVIMQVASTGPSGEVPQAIPQYSRGGGVIAWRNSIMLFVNVVPGGGKYANAFLEAGRKLIWFPSPGQTQHHPLIKRMLAACQSNQQGNSQGEGSLEQDRILLFCRKGIAGRWRPFVYLGQVGISNIDWRAGSNGVFVWELQDFEKLSQKPAFRNLVETLAKQ